MARVQIGNIYPSDEYLLDRCAPAGYGLGESIPKIVLTPDEAMLNGFYSVGNNDYVGDGTFVDWRIGFAQVLVQRRDQSVTQNANYNDVEWRRYSSNNGVTWQPWEWVNPPMEPGNEYRTPERWNGQPVYTALLSLGSPTVSPTPSTTSIKAKSVIRSHGHMGGSNLPIIDGTLNGANSAWVNAKVNSDGYITTEIYFGSGMTSKSVTLQVWYTKE